MSNHRYPAENGNFNKRLVSLAERIEAGFAEDSNANILRSIFRMARFAQDFRGVYCGAVRRVMSRTSNDVVTRQAIMRISTLTPTDSEAMTVLGVF